MFILLLQEVEKQKGMLLNNRFGEDSSAIRSLPTTVAERSERSEGGDTCCLWTWDVSMTTLTGLALSNMRVTFSPLSSFPAGATWEAIRIAEAWGNLGGRRDS